MKQEVLKEKLLEIFNGVEGDNYTKENLMNLINLLNKKINEGKFLKFSKVVETLKDIMEGIEGDNYTYERIFRLNSEVMKNGLEEKNSKVDQTQSEEQTLKNKKLLVELENEFKLFNVSQVIFSEKIRNGLNNPVDFSDKEDFLVKFIYRNNELSVKKNDNEKDFNFRMYIKKPTRSVKNPMIYLDVENFLSNGAIEILEEANYLIDKVSDL